VAQFDTIIFRGTDEEAASIYRMLEAEGLTPEENFVLRRHLNLNIPSSMQHFYTSMEDPRYKRIHVQLLRRLPEGAKEELVGTDN
jgi:hypothetical protein